MYVGASRYEAGLLAEAEIAGEGRHVHLLDDGFQHRQLARNVDIVVIHRSDLRERLLPAGRLRERLSSLERAGVIVLRQEDAELEFLAACLCGEGMPLLARATHAAYLEPSQARVRLLRDCPAGGIFRCPGGGWC